MYPKLKKISKDDCQ